jgi:hypothetical protein
MKPWLKAIFTCGLAVVLMSSPAFADLITLDLIPATGDVEGLPGSTVGWGYTITNNSTDWLQPESLNTDVFLNGTPNSIFDFPAVAPSSFVTLDFSLVATASCTSPPCGLYELTWDNGAPLGFSNNGTFTISSEFFDQNPANAGATDLGAAPDITAGYTATTGAVPEPSTLPLLITALAGASFCRAYKKDTNRH